MNRNPYGVHFFIMLKYIVALTILLIMCAYVSGQYKQDAENATNEAQPPVQEAQSTTNYEQSKSNDGNSKRHAPGWYSLFVWPDGITVWALMLTLVVIAEQTSETRRSADAAKTAAQAANESSKALILSERAWLVIEPVSGVKLDEYDCLTIWSWKITNIGKTPARLVETSAVCAKYTRWSDAFESVPNYEGIRSLNKRMLAPNDFVTINVISYDGGMDWNDSENTRPGTRLYIVACGYVKYLNSFGDVCESRFCSDFSWKAGQKSTIEFSSYLSPPSDAQSRYEYTLHT
jgi:hypothetical protein